jgi:hypothetical protein
MQGGATIFAPRPRGASTLNAKAGLPAALDGNELIHLGGNKVFSVVHRFVSCLGN